MMRINSALKFKSSLDGGGGGTVLLYILKFSSLKV